MRTDFWPVAGLRIRTPRIELRYPDERLIDELLQAAQRGVHDPASMPFTTPWTDRPTGEFERGFLQYHWGIRAAWSPDDWVIDFAVVVDGQAVGTQGIRAKNFAVLREVGTGSWLERARHGAGIGREMRAAVLHLAFAGLGARYATTEAFVDNPASLGVTRSLGYERDGTDWYVRRGEPAENHRFRLTRERWSEQQRDDIEIEGLDESREMLGLGAVS